MKIDDEARTKELRDITGHITYDDPLVDFFYLLMRDELPIGKVERLVRDSFNPPGKGETVFTNGWLAQYSKNLADMIRNAHQGDVLDVVTHDNVDLSKMEQEIIDSCKEGSEEQDQNTAGSSIEDAKNKIEQLRLDGELSAEDAEKIGKELADMQNEDLCVSVNENEESNG
ncbi:MAG: hypothetical protein WC523_00335 [Patescibacteria group bacterium]